MISPGDSSVPAMAEPTIAQDAPAAIALAKSPEYLMPPSAITGMSPAARAASMMAVNCGTPTPATIRVVQIDPGPIPTFTASAPAPISARVASPVATLPATTCTVFDSRLIRSTARATPSEWPCAVSITTISTPASISACERSNPASPTVEAAATLSRPISSLQAWGFKTDSSVSFSVKSPVSLPLASVTSNFSIRRDFIRLIAASRSTGSRSKARFSEVIITRTGVLSSEAKRMSRLVTMPRTRPCASTTGKPVML